jgi:hypothetical protein
MSAALRRRAIWLAVAGLLLLLAAANAHLVYVAVVSQPDCVDHVRGQAAKSACSPGARR